MRFSPSHRRSNRIPRRLRLEPLSDRTCPCATGQVGDTLFVTGDRLDDRIDISQTGGVIQVACDDGEAQVFRGVKHVEVNTWAGNDVVTANFTPGPDDDLTLRVDLGAGNDNFTATFFPTETIAPPPSDLPPGPCKLDVFGQLGNDRLSLFLGEPETDPSPHLFNSALTANFDGGAGDDTALIDITNVAVNAPMAISYVGGPGKDIASWDWEVVAMNASVTQTMNLGGGDDNAMIIYGNVAINADSATTVDLGGGSDVAALNAYNVAFNAPLRQTVNLGAGADDATFIWFNAAMNAEVVTNVLGGADPDTIYVTSNGTTVAAGGSLAVSADGGGAGDTVGFIWFENNVAPSASVMVDVDGGGGADTVGFVVIGGTVARDARFDVEGHGGAGADVLRFSSIGLLVESDGGANWCLDGNGGNDDVVVRLDLDGNTRGAVDMEVMGSAGDDNLTLSVAGIGEPNLLSALVDGGDGDDIARVSHDVLVENCEEVFVLE